MYLSKDGSAGDLPTSLFCQTVSIAVCLRPTSLAGVNARRGECQAARANVPFCLPTVSACPIAAVRDAVQGLFWFKGILHPDDGSRQLGVA
ncbi:alpha-hydroxy-acid oxidizing protein [Brevundimonas sp. TWP2-3-4b1]|uniref:alpha-hydroxy-acid oxidizing protein n=1 Tax=Brevundimonas sp. TWP2-3-4b1 TaxID=2804580 RepID=UPI003CEFCB03